MSLIHNINNRFNRESYYSKYSLDIWITIIAILIVSYIVIYNYILTRIKVEKVNWEKNKCNPFYMPFASKITNSSDEFVGDNLKSCLNGYTKKIAGEVLSPINGIINVFLEIFNSMAKVFTMLFTFIMGIINTIFSMFKEFLAFLMNIVEQNVIVFGQINNFLASILGFFAVIYNTVILLVDSIKLIFPIFALSIYAGFIIPSMVGTGIAIIIAFFALAIAYGFCWAFWGCPFFVIAVLHTILAILSIAFTVVLFIMYAHLLGFTKDVLERTLSRVDGGLS